MRRLLAICVALSSVPSHASAERPALRLVVNRSDEDVPRAGAPVLRDLTAADAFVSQRGGEATVTNVLERKDLFDHMRMGRGDVVISPFVGVGAPPEGLAFSKPVRQAKLVIVAKAGTQGAPSGTVYSFFDYGPALASAKLPAGVAVEQSWEVDDQWHLLERVALGEFKLGMVLDEELDGFLAYRSDVVRVATVATVPLVWAVRSGDKTLLAELNKFITTRVGAAASPPGDLDAILARRALRVAMANGPTSYFSDRGVEAGFQYELMQGFAASLGVRLSVIVPNAPAELATLVSSGAADAAVGAATDARELTTLTRAADTLDKGPVSLWLAAGATALAERAAQYLLQEKKSARYKQLLAAYFPPPRAIDAATAEAATPETGKALTGKALGPFDALTQRFGSQFGFDWRFVTAQMFHESRFNPKARSPVGALGLMQVMPKTGASLGFHQLDDPEQGTHAGVKYMAQMRKRWSELDDPAETLRFALASYNAGLGHVLDARALARERGKNPDIFHGHVSEMLLLLEDKAIYKKARHGYCRGSETVTYVKRIDGTYDKYRATPQ